MHDRSARRLLVPLALGSLAAGALLAGCGDSSDDAGGDASGDGLSADGAALYEESCASCHGSDLRGTERGPSHLSEVYEPGHHSDESFRSAIRNGSPAHHWTFGDMPPVAGLDDDQVEAIITFIRERQEAEGFEPYPPE